MGRSINFSGKKRQCRMHSGIAPRAFLCAHLREFNNPATIAFA
jgi:hypothetical protein